MRSRILGLGDDDTSLVHNTRSLKQQVPSKSAPNAVTFYSTRSTGSFQIIIHTSTSFAKIIWWTGEEEIVVANNPTATFTKAATASPTIKPITVFSCTSTGIPSGSFISLRAVNSANQLISVDTTQLKNADTFDVSTLANSSLSFSEKTNLVATTIQFLTGFNTIDCSSLRDINLSINLHSTVTGLKIILGVGNNSSLILRKVYLNTPSPIDIPIIPPAFAGYYSIIDVLFNTTIFDFSYRSLSYIQLESTNATEVLLNYSNTPNVSLFNNSNLVSVRCKDCVFTGYQSKKNKKIVGGLNVSACNLSTAALNIMFEDLGVVVPDVGFIQVQGNPGALTCNTSIATAKGYVVITQ